MKNVLLVKEIYSEAFRNLGSKFTKHSFKALALLFASSYLIALYALVFRISTGFAFE